MQAQLVEACPLNPTPSYSHFLVCGSSQPEERHAGRKRLPEAALGPTWLRHTQAEQNPSLGADEIKVQNVHVWQAWWWQHRGVRRSFQGNPSPPGQQVKVLPSQTDGRREEERESGGGRLAHGVTAVCLCWHRQLSPDGRYNSGTDPLNGARWMWLSGSSDLISREFNKWFEIRFTGLGKKAYLAI